MSRWLRRIRGVFGIGLTWAIAWAVVGGGIMEGIVDPDGRILDMWPQTLAIPGLLAGTVFAVSLALTQRRRHFRDLSVPRFAAWGAAAGALLGGLALAAGALPAVPALLRVAVLLGPLTLLSAASAAGTLVVARRAAGIDHLLEGVEDAPDRLHSGEGDDR